MNLKFVMRNTLHVYIAPGTARGAKHTYTHPPEGVVLIARSAFTTI